jgi:xanthine/uracil permease
MRADVQSLLETIRTLIKMSIRVSGVCCLVFFFRKLRSRVRIPLGATISILFALSVLSCVCVQTLLPYDPHIQALVQKAVGRTGLWCPAGDYVIA